jgi:hypothetical protein
VKEAWSLCGVVFVLLAVVFCLWVNLAVAGGPASDSKPAGEGRVPPPAGKSHAPAIYRCTLTVARAWDAGEFVTTTRYSDKACAAGEMQSQLNVVQSVVEHYRSDTSLHGGSVPGVH